MIHFGGNVSAKTLIAKLFERTCASVRCVARLLFNFLFNLRHILTILWPVWLNLTYSDKGRKISFSCMHKLGVKEMWSHMDS